MYSQNLPLADNLVGAMVAFPIRYETSAQMTYLRLNLILIVLISALSEPASQREQTGDQL